LASRILEKFLKKKTLTWFRSGFKLDKIDIRILETPEELAAVEEIQRSIWPGNEIEIVPIHIFRASIHNGGLVIGAYHNIELVGFVYGFPGFEYKDGNLHLYHASHMAGVARDFRDSGIGYKLKRAQWQIVRQQGIERITWTYDPLQSRNANLNLSKLGAVCNTYIPNYYGEMRDEINKGAPSDRFQVDWWVNSNRVKKRLSSQGRPKVNPIKLLNSQIPIVNRTMFTKEGFVSPQESSAYEGDAPLVLLEIPADIQEIKRVDMELAIQWSHHIRDRFIKLFDSGYIATDVIHLPDDPQRSFYVLIDGDTTF
jgi:predicted GNAT superfamily acetyltransferase